MEKAVEHSRNNARKFGTEQFGNMVLNLYQKEVWRGEYERNESIAYAKNEKNCVEKWSRTCNVHAKNALKSEQVELTCDPREDFDIVHLNTVFPSDYHMAKKAKREGKKVVYHAHSTKEDFRNSFVGSNLTAPLFNGGS